MWEFRLVQIEWDCEGIGLVVFHVMVIVVIIEQREYDEGSGRRDSACESELAVIVMPRAIESKFLVGEMWKPHRTPIWLIT